jgi:hypothetical protein
MNKLLAAIFATCVTACIAVPSQAQYNKAPPASTPAPAVPAAAPAAPAAAPIAAPVAATPINVPKHNCVKPEVAGKPKTNDELKVLNANLATYRDCLTVYSTEMRRYADAHIEAGNVSVEEYNEFIKVVREKTK